MSLIQRVEIALDETAVKEHIQKLIEDAARPQLLFWGIEEIAIATSLEKSYLERHLITDPRMKALERSRGPKCKKLWPYQASVQVITEIIDEWY